MPRSIQQLLVAVVAVAALAAPVAAQQAVTTSDIQRLEQSIDQLDNDVWRLRQASNRASTRSLMTDLSTLDEEVIYLKVKLRKEGRVTRAEYNDVSRRIDTLRSRLAREGGSSGVYPGTPGNENDAPSAPSSTEPGLIPTGTELDVRLQTALSSDTAQVEDRFEATTAVDLRQDGRVVIPAGSLVRGVVTGVREAGRIERKGSLTLSFDQITVNGRNYPIRGTVAQVLESGGYRDDAEKIGAGAAVGGILGGILGGLKGALAGVLIGGGGVVAATEGADVELAPGTVLRMRLDAPLTVRGNFTRR